MKQFIDIEDIKLCYEVQGEGEPVLILHGWGCSKDTVQSITEHIAKTHRAYALDMPGFGETPPPNEVFGIEQYTQVVEKFCRKLFEFENFATINPFIYNFSCNKFIVFC